MGALLPVVAVAQAGLHVSFGLLSPAGHAAHGGHVEDASGGLSWSGQMLAAHALVTVLTAVVWRLCERAAVAVVVLLAGRQVYTGGRRDTIRGAYRPPAAARLLRLASAPLRGPPLVFGDA